MKVACSTCGKTVDTTKHGKVAPHNNGNTRCAGSGKRVEQQIKEKNK